MRLSCFLFDNVVLGSVIRTAPQAVRPDISIPPGTDATKTPTELEIIPINTVLYWITKFFPFDIIIKNSGDLTRIAEDTLASILGIETIENATSGGRCADVTIVFARGTNEVGNVGVVVGPELFAAVAARLGASGATLAVQGVDYPATIPGFLQGGDPAGSQQMADDVSRLLTACPDTTLVMAGYSQGGQLVHDAARLLPTAILAKVSLAVIFGDPNYPAQVAGVPASNQLVICHSTDDICQGGDVVHLSHMTYATDVDQAGDFVISHMRHPPS